MNHELIQINFATAREQGTVAWDRATVADADRLDRVSWLGWVVKLPDSPRQHRVRLAYDPTADTWVGHCTCQHVRYGEGNAEIQTCAHLATVRKLDDRGTETVARANPAHHECPTCGRPHPEGAE